MQPGGIHHAELILLFLLFMVGGLTTLSRRFETPYPIVLVVGGLLLSFHPQPATDFAQSECCLSRHAATAALCCGIQYLVA